MAFRRILLMSVFALLISALTGGSGSRSAELVMFDQPGCVWCQRFEAEVASGYANSTEGRRAPLRRVDIRAQGEAGFALAQNVRITPTFVLVDGDREVGRLTGYPGKDFFWTELAALIARLSPTPRQD
ncbi:thioredoxin fold domain-containing protein [Hansschlegelia zhihuaiae]|uniref:Transcriptional regulator n=1 Tax=Hansschlegelia zhihuaiae TaxID=405005 RepID=A0A4Q0M9K5_9HYPH|nr:thioredoxin fold domain-containing protein [Hansschlegelia zhihuaiae]RXF69877.1 transcriptional regulator [Hansschlegelia zhihuaiae]